MANDKIDQVQFTVKEKMKIRDYLLLLIPKDRPNEALEDFQQFVRDQRIDNQPIWFSMWRGRELELMIKFIDQAWSNKNRGTGEYDIEDLLMVYTWLLAQTTSTMS